MYYAMVYLPNEWGNFNLRAIRRKGYATLKAAKQAINRVGHDGYVQKLGTSIPVWSKHA